MSETRVNLKKILERIRDEYPFSPDETVIVESISNSLDSQASEINFYTDKLPNTLIVTDNGEGMNEKELVDYHDLAVTTKVKGKGIGFAGIGAKLALLFAKKIITETKSKELHKATEWRLENEYSAPWKYIEPTGLVNYKTGTSIAIELSDESFSKKFLLVKFIENTIKKHFLPLFNESIMAVLSHYYNVYKDGVSFYINGKKIGQEIVTPEEGKQFLLPFGKEKRILGTGIIYKYGKELEEDEFGISVSSYGKIIKKGWEWLNIMPRNPNYITGIIEVPLLAEILTTNKVDFLLDEEGLKKYNAYKKVIQQTIKPILTSWGEIEVIKGVTPRAFMPFKREIEYALDGVISDYNELRTLFVSTSRLGKVISKNELPKIEQEEKREEKLDSEFEDEEKFFRERIEHGFKLTTKSRDRKAEITLPIGFVSAPDKKDIGWIEASTILINRAHPAYKRVLRENRDEKYHILLSIAIILSRYLSKDRSPQEFISRFLEHWGLL